MLMRLSLVNPSLRGMILRTGFLQISGNGDRAYNPMRWAAEISTRLEILSIKISILQQDSFIFAYVLWWWPWEENW